MKAISLLVSASLALSCAYAANSPKTQLEEARKIATKDKKDLMMVFSGSEWHTGCQNFEKKVLNTDEFKKATDPDFVSFLVPVPNQRAQAHKELLELEKEYRFRNMPSIILADSAARPYAYTTSTKSVPAEFLKHIKELHQIRIDRDKTFAEAAKAKGVERAKLYVKALKTLPQDIISDFYSAELTMIAQADPKGETVYVQEIEKAEAMRLEQVRFSEMFRNKEYDKVMEVARAEGAKLKGEDAQRFKLYEIQALFAKNEFDKASKEVEAMKKLAPDSDLGKRSDGFLTQIRNAKTRREKMAEAAKNPKPRKPVVSKPVAIVTDINELKKEAQSAQDDLAKALQDEDALKKEDAKLTKEVTEAEAALKKLKESAAKSKEELQKAGAHREKMARRAKAMKEVVENHEAMEKRKRDIAELEKRAGELQKQADSLRKKATDIKKGK